MDIDGDGVIGKKLFVAAFLLLKDALTPLEELLSNIIQYPDHRQQNVSFHAFLFCL